MTPLSPKKKREENKPRQVVRLQDVLEEVLEECPKDSKPIDDADDDTWSFCYSSVGWVPWEKVGLMYDEEEEEGSWHDFTWGSPFFY